METLQGLLIFIVAIAVIYFGARWNTSDADYWLGFGPPPRRKGEDGDDEKAEK